MSACDRSKKQQTCHRTVEYIHSGKYSKETVTSHGNWGAVGEERLGREQVDT